MAKLKGLSRLKAGRLYHIRFLVSDHFSTYGEDQEFQSIGLFYKCRKSLGNSWDCAFYVIANDENYLGQRIYSLADGYFLCPRRILGYKEIKIDDLIMYIGMPHKLDFFGNLFSGKMRLTQVRKMVIPRIFMHYFNKS